MQLKASLPVNKEVLAGPYADLVRRGAGVRGLARVRPAQAVVQGLQRVHHDCSRTELDANVFNAPNKTAKEAIDDGRARSSNALLASQ